jgi:hypothetical protein
MRRRNLLIDDSIWKRLVNLATQRGSNVSELIRLAIYEFLVRNE